MPRLSPFVALERGHSVLMKEREQHVDALAKIDAVFAKFGIKFGEVKVAPVISVATPVAPASVPARKKRRLDEGRKTRSSRQDDVAPDSGRETQAGGGEGRAR